MLIVTLIGDHETRARVANALRGQADVRSCRFVHELEARIRGSGAHGIIVTPWDETGIAVEPTVRSLRRDYPAVPMAVYAPLTPQATSHVVALARAGIDEVILRGYDDLGASVRMMLERAVSARAASEALRMLSVLTPAPATTILAYCLEHAQESLTVDALATALGVHRKTLLNRLAASALPPPSTLISWCRLFVAARLLEDGVRTVEQVAVALGFGSATALRNMFRRYTGLRPAEIRRRGGLRCMAGLFQGRATPRTLAPAR